MKSKLSFLFIMLIILSACSQKPDVKYPETKKGDAVDDYFGTQVADPYRWLEDNNSEETTEWVNAQNNVTYGYLDQIPFREDFRKRLTELWDYEKYSAPRKIGKYYFFSKNDGLQEQSVVYYQEGLDGEPVVFLDPNTFSDDGSISLAGMAFSNDDKYCSYAISKGGSDWREIFVMDVDTREKLDDHIIWAKFTGMAWYKDGFYYSRYDAPKEGEELKAKNEFQKLYYHKLGTPQSEDVLVLEDKTNPQRGFSAGVTSDENYLIISGWEGSASENVLYYQNLSTGSPIKMLIEEFEAEYGFVENINEKFLIMTNYDAPNKKLVMIDPANPEKSNWTTVIPESENVINSAAYVSDKLLVSYLVDANTKVFAFDIEGNKLYDIELPGIGTAYGFGGEKEDTELFYTFTSFTYPPTIFKYDVVENKSELFRKSDVKFNPDDYETKQVFYKSKDGKEIPLFIVHKKGLELNGNNPTLLYAYGGFDISMTPSFRLTAIPIIESGGIYAMACLRGGGEYGKDWHEAGMLDKKQNVFDDFISAAEYLIAENYTNPEMLACQGGSNGGLLVGAVINQRPDLFKVALPAVGVMDMLRFHKFTIGWAWVPEYGSSDNEDQFEFLYAYSPLHNIKEGVRYPATMVTTADHDDRVFPAHSFKYAAALQEKAAKDNPLLIRIETKVGHGAGTSTSKTIDLYTDLWSFMFYNFGLEPELN
ncbi:MAG: prolyl oligopeptidase family serine peptidase [Melioribacteraceae bacterium]|nr:prolyl oligopeptidase family serine peptidase [Melioribacteraceae bacterium]MCF8353567.1 prolyl oligopeptidase family serine peptidase [Melioribacteraceae bacterium]MCF8393490.1 prolyl oligopeptidase family serine peptidase [Melioribacteraceae bacterium]MCF8419300.1 prolyl oligopeptidase family serine peptidase [Melioribacteraceae bacterium]